MCERKKTGVHGTLEMILLAWKFNSKQLLCKTLNSRMNIIETRDVFNIINIDRKDYCPKAAQIDYFPFYSVPKEPCMYRTMHSNGFIQFEVKFYYSFM